MPKVSKESAAQVDDHGPVVEAHEDVHDYTIQFLTVRQDMDATPLLKGLPNDMCQCPHWGYVLKGRIGFRFADREELFEAGDAFYVPPGHTPQIYEGAEFVQFSPGDELKVSTDTINRNFQEMMAAR